MKPSELPELLADVTQGEWSWYQSGRQCWVRGSHGRIVMDFVRSGMDGAEPRFALGVSGGNRGDSGGLMFKASELEKDPHIGFKSHPDARMIALSPALARRVIEQQGTIRSLLARFSPEFHTPVVDDARALLDKEL